MKKKIFVLAAALMSVTLFSCDDDDNAELGRKAAVEFCDCLSSGNSKSECEDALKDKYSKAEYTHSDFVDAFNEVGEPSCGVTIEVYTY